ICSLANSELSHTTTLMPMCAAQRSLAHILTSMSWQHLARPKKTNFWEIRENRNSQPTSQHPPENHGHTDRLRPFVFLLSPPNRHYWASIHSQQTTSTRPGQFHRHVVYLPSVSIFSISLVPFSCLDLSPSSTVRTNDIFEPNIKQKHSH